MKFDLIGAGVFQGWALRFEKSIPDPFSLSLCLLPAEQVINVSTTVLVQYLPASHHDDLGLTV